MGRNNYSLFISDGVLEAFKMFPFLKPEFGICVFRKDQ